MHARKKTCPEICGKEEKKKTFGVAGGLRGSDLAYAAPYVPGRIVPAKPIFYPKDAPPRYLPQPTDTLSGDMLTMGPVGPWAPGHMDWTPQAGSTGVRPVVEKYSITRYSTGQWRQNNKTILEDPTIQKVNTYIKKTKDDLNTAFKELDDGYKESNNMLDKRVKDLTYWKNEVEKALADMTKEIELLDNDRAVIKAASRIFMTPEAVSKECLEIRTHRYEPDMVRDDAEQELVKEVAIVGEIRRVFNETLTKVNEQMDANKAAKISVESDWSAKNNALKYDKLNKTLTPDSNLIMAHPGIARWPDNSATLDYWEHYCKESIRNCNEVRKKSEELRKDLMNIIKNGSQDLKIQTDRTSIALAEHVSTTQELCDKLEETLKHNLQEIADLELFILKLKEDLRNLHITEKLCETRIRYRHNERYGAENCRDEAQYALMLEHKMLKEKIDQFNESLRNCEAIKSELLIYRGNLEKAIASKRKSLLIDGDRLQRLRKWIPTPEEFANIVP